MLNLKLNETDLSDSLGKFRHGRECSLDPQPNEFIPARFNWADAGVVSPVIMQKGCGACYVISTTSAMESQYMILHKETGKVRFSIQATLNCMANGCAGGSLVVCCSFPTKLRKWLSRTVAATFKTLLSLKWSRNLVSTVTSWRSQQAWVALPLASCLIQSTFATGNVGYWRRKKRAFL